MLTINETLQAGLDHHRAGRLHEAEKLYRRVLEMHPRHASAGHLLGLIAFQVGQHEQALVFLNGATEIDGFNPVFQADLGEILRVMGKTPEAMTACQRALEINPNMADVHKCLGHLQQTQGDLHAAIASFREAVRLEPEHAAAHAALGTALRSAGQLNQAQSSMERAVRLAPDSPSHYLGLGVCHYDQGELLDAMACYQKTLRLAPDNIKARYNRALARLALGDFGDGWRDFETRHLFDTLVRRRYALPMWNGEAVQNGRLLIHAEQGFGDTLQFVRYVPLVEERGVQVVVDVHEELVSLCEQSGLGHVVCDGAAPDGCTCQIPLMSLPRVFGTTLESIPAKVPYLSAQEASVNTWREKLAGHKAFRVGIHWQGRPTYYNDRARSIPPEHFGVLAAVEGVQLVSLQKTVDAEQLAAVFSKRPIVDLGEELGDFHETAAVMRNLDLVISCDSAPAHLAGALGIPVWVALPVGSDWRWLQGREDSPWYPTMRLFRQKTLGAWEEIFAQMAGALATLAGASGDAHR